MKILIADDIEDARLILKKTLELAGYTVLVAANGLDALRIARDSSPEIIVSDILMPEMDGFRFCREVKRDPLLRDVPFVFYTATYTDVKDEKLAAALGASRFIVKPLEVNAFLEVIRDVIRECKERKLPVPGKPLENDSELLRIYEESIQQKLDKKIKDLEKERKALLQREDALRESEQKLQTIVALRASSEMERMRVEATLLQSEERFRAMFESAPIGISIANRDGTLIRTNPAFQKMLGYTQDELIMSFSEITHPEDVESNFILFKEMTEGNRDFYEMQKRYIRKDGSIMWANLTVSAIRDENGAFKYNFAIIEDVSEKRKLEDQLRHAQKMEAVGQLAGGVAHDFNNILTAIIGYGNLLKMKLKGDEQQEHHVNQILAISERGSSLTQSLLAFSRKQVIALKPISLNKLIKRIGKLIPRLIGEEIEFVRNLSDKDMIVMADSSQLEQVLMNLAGNARDAMPGGGVFTIETELVDLDNEYIKMHGFGMPGPHALITVSDTGEGIDEETKKKIFEPFFTTKEVGEGTGLGLSLVYGIIKQHEGYINVYSELDLGTSFKIYLPLLKDMPGEHEDPGIQSITGGQETILLAEDEAEVRGAISGILQEYGFTIIEAVDGKDAVAKYSENRDGIQLLIFDVVMPKINGKEAYDEIKKITPGMKAIFTSGYTTKTIHAKGVLEDGLHFLSKPVQPRNLLRKIREVLDES